jgi:hypothetical protein
VRRQRESGSTKQQAAIRFCYIVLITGLGCKVVEMFCAFLGVAFPSNSTFYAAHPRLIAHILEWAVTSCAMVAQAVTIASVLAFVGSWNHPRWGTQCLGCFIDLSQRKAVDFHIASKKGKTKKDAGEVDAASQALEGISFKAMATRWADRDEQVRAMVHDRDAKVSKIKERIVWGIGECFDKNHVMLGFRNAWKRHAQIVVKGKRQPTVLKGRIELEVRIRFYRILKMDASLESRRAEWRKTVERFTGKESTRADKSDPVQVRQLGLFVEATVDLMNKIDEGAPT